MKWNILLKEDKDIFDWWTNISKNNIYIKQCMDECDKNYEIPSINVDDNYGTKSYGPVVIKSINIDADEQWTKRWIIKAYQITTYPKQWCNLGKSYKIIDVKPTELIQTWKNEKEYYTVQEIHWRYWSEAWKRRISKEVSILYYILLQIYI